MALPPSPIVLTPLVDSTYLKALRAASIFNVTF
jgi:hypothetical protein